MYHHYLRFIIVLIGLASSLPAYAQGDKETPKPSFGDRDDVVPQNKRYLKVRNETDATLTVNLQFRTFDAGVWSWFPDDPAKSTESLSFEIEAGKELDVKHKDQPIAASRMRIWAAGPNQKWLTNKTTDVWLVPEKTEDGEHIYTASGVETFTFVFSSSKDKGVIPGDTDVVGEQSLPSEGENIPAPIPYIPWDDLPSPLPPEFPIVRDLAVLPVFSTGLNATVRVKNVGHFNLNLGRRLMVQKVAPGSVPEDKGPIGPLFHFSVKTFFLVGMTPGNYIAFISPGDDAPRHFNDKKSFTITALAFPDAAVLPVSIVAGKAFVKVKNLGTAPTGAAQRLNIVKLPGGVPVDHGPVGVLAANDIKAFPGIMLPAGNYKAFITPGEAAPHQANDDRLFSVAAATFADHDVISVFVAAGKATIKIKNIGAADAPAGQSLKITKLPGGPTVDHGPIGALASNAIKTFLAIPLAPGNYRAFVSPGNAPPHHANDDDFFVVPGATFADHDITGITVSAGKATIKIKNIGTADALAGQSLKIQKLPGGPIVEHGPIPALAVNAVKTFLAIPLAPGNYKAFVSPGNPPPHHANDSQVFNVATSADLEVSVPSKVGGMVKGAITNNGPGMYAGARTWHIEKLGGGGVWNPIPTVGSHVIPGLPNGATHPIQGTFTGPGTYRIRITAGDATPGNDVKTKVLP